MSHRHPVNYLASPELAKEAVSIALKASGLKGGTWRPSMAKESYFDTFDWRLYKKGMLLCRRGLACVLTDRQDGAKLCEAKVKGDLPKFAKDFPHGRLKEELLAAAGPRALLRICSVGSLAASTRILNPDDKTVAHARHVEMRMDGEDSKPFASVLEFLPMKGYAEEFDRVAEALDDEGLSRFEGQLCPLSLAMRASGRMPDDYSSKFESPVKQGMPCREAAAAILSRLMNAMERNIQGVLKDIDAEFLHDFRVATRRIRAALSQIKGAFPQRETAQFRKDFSLIGKLTNKLRDMDVMLMSQAEYEAMLPKELKPGLREFFAGLEERRKAEYSKLAAELSSPRYAKTFKKWKLFLGASGKLPPSDGSQAKADELAAGFIHKRLAKISKMAEALDESSPDAETHSLRIECKKLRYLLEFFGPVCQGRKLEAELQRLKELQDLMGRMNDLSVQRRLLMESLFKLPSGGRGSLLSAAALGCLVAKLSERRERLRRELGKALSKFADRKVMDGFKESIAEEKGS